MRTLDEAVFFALQDIDPQLAGEWLDHFCHCDLSNQSNVKNALFIHWTLILSQLPVNTMTIRYHLSDTNHDEAWFGHFHQDVLPLVRQHLPTIKQYLRKRSAA